jgi:hypothetical protein
MPYFESSLWLSFKRFSSQSCLVQLVGKVLGRRDGMLWRGGHRTWPSTTVAVH